MFFAKTTRPAFLSVSRAFRIAVIALSSLTFFIGAMSVGATPIEIYAAGSLREAMQTLEKAYRDERQNEKTTMLFDAKFLFGPSGKLRERIEAGERPALFASAAPEHTERLHKSGLLRSSNLFAGNALCLLTRPGFAMGNRGVVDVLLAEHVMVGTSTPGADPSGDYTWQMFRKIDAARPGAFATLNAKAKKLTGAEINPNEQHAAYARILKDGSADVFVSYCTNAKSAQRMEPAIGSVAIPSEFNVVANYSIGIAPSASDEAREFLRFMLSERARHALQTLGFSLPQPKCTDVPTVVRSAHDAWNAVTESVTVSSSDSGAAVLKEKQRYRLSLLPVETLSVARASATTAASNVRKQSGGVVRFVASAVAHVEVFTDRRAWFDLVRERDGKVLESIRSDRWLGCAGVGKNLGFHIEAGERYRIELSEIDGATMDVLLMPLDLR